MGKIVLKGAKKPNYWPLSEVVLVVAAAMFAVGLFLWGGPMRWFFFYFAVIFTDRVLIRRWWLEEVEQRKLCERFIEEALDEVVRQILTSGAREGVVPLQVPPPKPGTPVH